MRLIFSLNYGKRSFSFTFSDNFASHCYASYMGPTRKFSILYILGFFAVLVSRWPGHDSEDIKNLRLNTNSSHPTDFWGGASSMFYGHFPNFYPGWESLLLIFQWGVTSAGLALLTKKLQSGWKVRAVWFLISLLVVELGTLLTRDGLMLALLVFGFGLVNASDLSSPRRRNAFLKMSLIVFLIAAWFRPWVSPAIAVLYIYSSKFASSGSTWHHKLLKRFVLILVFMSLALGFEIGSSKILNLEKSYPEQQVMMMDLASMACWSTNQATVDRAISGLANFYQTEKVPNYFCNTFRPTNWIHLFHQDLVSKQQPVFTLIQIGDFQGYSNVRSVWFKSITSSPVDYIQNKLMYASQTLLGGDTRGIRLFSSNYFENSSRSEFFTYFSALVLMPLDAAITIHLFSTIFTFLFFSILVYASTKQLSRYKASELIGLSLFSLLWFAGTVIAYIGDTARFTYTSGALILLAVTSIQFRSRRSPNFPGKD
jgi:hypothetical protein